MKIVGLIPAQLGTDKIPFRNVKDLGGIPLIDYTIRTMNKVSMLDDIVIFSGDKSICDYISKGLRYSFIKRPTSLDNNGVTSSEIINSFLGLYEADLIVLLHITSPFLSSKTIVDCIDNVRSGNYGSAFTAIEVKKFSWFKGRPLNYSLESPTPRTQDIEPVIVEQSHLYVFNVDAFRLSGQRVTPDPYIKIIDSFEGHDIDSDEEFKMAKLIATTGFYEIT